MFYLMNVLVDLDSSSPRTNYVFTTAQTANLSSSDYLQKSKMATGQILNKYFGTLGTISVIHLLWVFV